jgi:hypothetical protein
MRDSPDGRFPNHDGRKEADHSGLKLLTFGVPWIFTFPATMVGGR